MNLTLGYTPSYVGSDISPFNLLFNKAVDVHKQGYSGVDALILWGGTDIHPSYYGEKAHPTSQVFRQTTPSHRDVVEWRAMQEAKKHNIPIIGVCRGAQFLTAFAGGRLVQNMNGHGSGSHDVVCVSDGKEETFATTSCHHQMMYPYDVEHELLGWVPENHSEEYQVGPDASKVSMKNRLEPEVVYYPKVKGFGIQGHPEWMSEKDPFVIWCMKQIKEKFYA